MYELPPITELRRDELIQPNARLKYLHLYGGRYWRLYLNENQHLLGRAYLWLTSRHVDFHPFDDLNEEELRELCLLTGLYRGATQRLWGAALLNVQWWGNEAFGQYGHRGHGHLHLVPRYTDVVEFDGARYPDVRFGKNYHPYEPNKLPPYRLAPIAQALKDELIVEIP